MADVGEEDGDLDLVVEAGAGFGKNGTDVLEAGDRLLGMKEPVVARDPEVMGGTPVFAGTRVPVQTLLDYLEGGETIDDFLQGFPSVNRAQVIAFLEEAKNRLVELVP